MSSKRSAYHKFIVRIEKKAKLIERESNFEHGGNNRWRQLQREYYRELLKEYR